MHRMHADHLKLPSKLRQARAARGLSQRDVARLAGVDVSWLCRAENGQGLVPTDASVRRLAAALRLNETETNELTMFARRDRVVRVCAEQVPDGAPLVASVLEASIILDRSESAGLTRVVEELVESKQRNERLKAVDLHSHPNVEGCMP